MLNLSWPCDPFLSVLEQQQGYVVVVHLVEGHVSPIEAYELST